MADKYLCWDDISGFSGSNLCIIDDKVSLDGTTAAIRKQQKNDDSCPLYKLSNDELKLIFGSVGENNYRFVACTSYRFSQVYLDTFGGETLTSIDSALASVSCAALCLHSEEPGCDSHAVSLFRIAATEGKLEILIWGEDSRNELETMLHSLTIVHAALNGHLEVLKNLSQIDILWNKQTLVMIPSTIVSEASTQKITTDTVLERKDNRFIDSLG